MIKHNDQNGYEKHPNLEGLIKSQTGFDNILNQVHCLGQSNTVSWDDLRLETQDIEDIIDGSEINLYFANNTIKGNTTWTKADTNANLKRTVFVPDREGVYLIHGHIYIDVAMDIDPITVGTRIDGELSINLNDSVYSWVRQDKWITNTAVSPVNINPTVYSVQITRLMPLRTGEEVHLSFKTGWSALYTGSNLDTYEVYGNFNVSHVNCEYDYENDADITVYAG